MFSGVCLSAHKITQKDRSRFSGNVDVVTKNKLFILVVIWIFKGVLVCLCMKYYCVSDPSVMVEVGALQVFQVNHTCCVSVVFFISL